MGDHKTNTAVAFIGSNDPHVNSAPLELCKNRCGEMEWVDWDRNDLESGYKYYSKKNQLSQVKKLLKTNNKLGALKIIDPSRSGTHYFAKGHLSPDAAFVYNVMQDATYYFMNAAPQFQSFNNGNWKALEYNTRDLATKLGRDLQVTTGTYGMLSYPDNNNNPTHLYLFNGTYVPAPKYYWKVVQDHKTNTAVAFIGSNDPHVNSAP